MAAREPKERVTRIPTDLANQLRARFVNARAHLLGAVDLEKLLVEIQNIEIFRELEGEQIKRQMKKFKQISKLRFRYGRRLMELTIVFAKPDSAFLKQSIFYILAEVLMVFESVTPKNGCISLFTDLRNFLLRVRRKILCDEGIVVAWSKKDEDYLTSLKNFISKVLLPFYGNVWSKLSQVEETNGRGAVVGGNVDLYVSDIELDMSHERYLMTSNRQSVVAQNFFQNTCMRELIANVEPSRMFYDVDEDKVEGWTPYVEQAKQGNSKAYEIVFLKVVELAVYEQYCQYLTIEGVMNAGQDAPDEDHSGQECETVNHYLEQITYFVEGAAMRAALGTLVKLPDCKIAIGFIVTKLTVPPARARELKLPCALIDEREKKAGGLLRVEQRLHDAVISLDNEVLLPLYTNMSTMSVLGNNFIGYVHEVAMAHSSIEEVTDLFYECFTELIKCKQTQKHYKAMATSLTIKFFDYFLGACDNDWNRLLVRQVKELNNPMARLSFRERVMTNTLNKVEKSDDLKL